MKRLFHAIVALAVALPLGVGGFCCCLLGHGPEAAPAAVADAGSCCSAEDGVPAPAPGEERPCDCPARELAVFAKAPAGSLVPEAAPPVLLIALPAPVGSPLAFASRAAIPSPPYPPPKQPLYRTLSVLRC